MKFADDELDGMSEHDLANVLDKDPHDESVHRAMVELKHLPPSIADRLLRLIRSPLLREHLINRHSFSSEIAREAIKSSRSRPNWWR